MCLFRKSLKRKSIFRQSILINILTFILYLLNNNITCTFAHVKFGPFVYRLGRQVFILERGVRLPYGLQIKIIMANHKSALKRIRSSEKKRLINRLQHKTTRNAIKKLKETSNKKEAKKMFPSVISLIDKLAKKNIIHINKAGNLKSKLSKYVGSL